ncbi:MAG: polysaccharide biosynthesis tyrosine autokinase [Thermoanaerobaculia bacterium]
MSPLTFTDDPFEEEPGLGGPQLSAYLDILRRRLRLIAACVLAALLIAGIISFVSTPMYRGTTLLNLDPEASSSFEVGGTSGRSSVPDAELFATETQLMRNRQVAERVVEKLKLAGGSQAANPIPGAVTKAALRIQHSIEVKPVRGTNLIELSYLADSPKKAADLANAVAEAYIDWKLDLKFRVIGQASKFLAAQIDEAKRALSEKEQRLLAMGRQKDILDIAPQSNPTLQKLTALGQDVTSTMADRISKETRYTELQKANPDSLPESLATGAILQQRSDLARLEREYTDKLSVFKPEWPAMQALQAQIGKARSDLKVATREAVEKAREAAKADYEMALRREGSVKEALQRQRSEAMSMSRGAIDYNNLRVEVETQRALVDNLLKREAEMQVLLRLQGERLTNVRIVESALPPGAPFKPSYPKNALLGLIAGLFGGVGLAFLLDSLDRSVRSAEQVVQYLRLPVLGIIPPSQAVLDHGYGYGYGYSDRLSAEESSRPLSRKPKKSIPIELLPHDIPQSTVAEAYRAFRTSLLLSRADGVKSLVVTSAVPLEGKTSNAVNLAIVLGQLGRRVLLVDTDLRRPRIHEILNVSNRVGLVSVLAARTDLVDAIQPTHIANVSVLTAGPIAPDPSGLLHSEAMKRLVASTGSAFDHVVFDSPPVLAVTDAVLIAHLTDGAILCVRAGVTSRDKIAQARDELLRGQVAILGVLLNSARDEARTGPGAPQYARPEEKESGDSGSMSRTAAVAS